MAFGQAAGPPASAKQIAYLESLVKQAGHDSFRDARHPLGLTQRQAGGKFTKQEASELIDRLQDAGGDAAAPGRRCHPVSSGSRRLRRPGPRTGPPDAEPSRRGLRRAPERRPRRRAHPPRLTCTPPPST